MTASPPACRSLGTFAVEAVAAEVDAFRAATCFGQDGTPGSVPLTFPMRWLMQPDVRQAILTLLPETDLIPVHEAQSFDYARPLRPGHAYQLAVSGQRLAEPARLLVEATVNDGDGSPCVRLDTTLRLVATTP